MRLFIDLSKSGGGNLILKKVAVHMPSGKVVYANRWVDPSQGSEPIKHATHQQLDPTPTHKWDAYHKGLDKKQKSEVESRKQEFSTRIKEGTGKEADEQDLRDMEMEHRDTQDRNLIHPERDKDIIDTKEDGSHHDFYHPDIMDEVRHRHNASTTVDSALAKADGEGYEKIKSASKILLKDKKLKESLVNSMQFHIDHDPDTREEVKEIQRKTIALIQDTPFAILGCDPVILKRTLKSVLGDVYDKAKEKLGKANFSMNVPTEHLQSILENGYRPADLAGAKRGGKTPDQYTPDQKKYENKTDKMANSIDEALWKKRKPFSKDVWGDDWHEDKMQRYLDHVMSDPYLEDRVGKKHASTAKVKKPDGSHMTKEEIYAHNDNVDDHKEALAKPDLWTISEDTFYGKPRTRLENGDYVENGHFSHDELRERNNKRIERHKELREKFGLPKYDYENMKNNKGDIYQGDVEAMGTKLMGDHLSAGVPLNGDRPSYFTLNPEGDPKGPKDLPDIYGHSCFEVDEKALANSTATYNGIQETNPIPKVHSMDHATDLYLLKKMAHGTLDKFMGGEDHYHDWKEVIPLEFLYHNPKQKGLLEGDLLTLTHK